MAVRSSLFSRSNSLIRALSALLRPGRSPASRSACRHHWRSVHGNNRASPRSSCRPRCRSIGQRDFLRPDESPCARSSSGCRGVCRLSAIDSLLWVSGPFVQPSALRKTRDTSDFSRRALRNPHRVDRSVRLGSTHFGPSGVFPPVRFSFDVLGRARKQSASDRCGTGGCSATPKPNRLRLCVDGRARDCPAVLVAVPQEQGRKQEMCAVSGRAPARALRTHLPCEANG